MYGSNSWDLPAGHIQAFFREARQYLEERPQCRDYLMECIRRDFPWLHVMLLNDAESPSEPVLR